MQMIQEPSAFGCYSKGDKEGRSYESQSDRP